MKDSTVFTLAGVTGFAGSEALAVHLLLSESFTPETADWVITLVIGGPALFVLVGIPLMVVCSLIAMARYPR